MMASVAPFPSTTPIPAVARILSRFNREQLHGFIAVAIDLADAMDGDSDVEPNGDELDGTNAEDEEHPGRERYEPGCPISDPDCCVDDEGEYTDDREVEDYVGGHTDLPHGVSRFYVTA